MKEKNRLDIIEVIPRYFWESNLFDLNMNKLLASIQTQSFEPASTDALAHEYGKLIIKKMWNIIY